MNHAQPTEDQDGYDLRGGRLMGSGSQSRPRVGLMKGDDRGHASVRKSFHRPVAASGSLGAAESPLR
jgi:hypothetical protein